MDNGDRIPHTSVSYQESGHDMSANEEPLTQLDNGLSRMSQNWPDPDTQSSECIGFPLTDQVTTLGRFLCGCPGFGWAPSSEYTTLPNELILANDPSKPYATEKQPSMLSHVGGGDLALLDNFEYGTFQYQTFPSFQPPSSLSAEDNLDQSWQPGLVDDAMIQHANPVPGRYGNNYIGQESAEFRAGYWNHESQIQPLGSPTDIFDIHFREMPFNAGDSHLSMLHPTRFGDLPGAALAQHETSQFDIMFPHQRAGKRGPFKDIKLREQTAQTRRTGSCIRCRIQRIRCESDPTNPGGKCLTCTNALYKPGQVPGYEWTSRWKTSITDPIQQWESNEVKVIHVSSSCSKKHIELQVRQFVPQVGDKLTRTWDYKGMRRSVTIPPYALIDLNRTTSAYTAHMHDIMTDTLENVLQDSAGGLLRKTYFWAVRRMMDAFVPADASWLLRQTLTLWVSIRLSTTSSFIVGNETLGMPGTILDTTSPHSGKIPIPPVLGAQLDLVLIHHIQSKLRREVLDGLQKMVLKNKQSTWFVAYLVTFILLHNTSLITAHDAGYARKHGMKRRFAREDKVQEYHTDQCNDRDLRLLADLSDDEIQFVHATRYVSGQNRQAWRQLWDSGACENDFYFISQLFEEDWKPHMTVV
ncbi:tetratricopeptide repeat domain containing protein [Drechmeria coniospora]|uniref:Tetratricopeptide repeat domain containing protein n=1 Tax=Drechmeria coniospora TaxID=98403 RepID=A0A151GKQ3_DRECN|nr:tetratricopeptide repeat domain containing protein [Drechmeria coniospora]KYK57680.1 tetratricopeptide repeat domain containing protein [Drechmeria coniospora]